MQFYAHSKSHPNGRPAPTSSTAKKSQQSCHKSIALAEMLDFLIER